MATPRFLRNVFLCAFLAVAELLVSGCATTGSSSASAADLQKRQQAIAKSDLLIVPGQRIGPIRLGMGWDEVIATLGEPDFQYVNAGDPNKIVTQMRYFSLSMEVFFSTSATPIVTQVRTLVYTTRATSFGEMMWAGLEPVATAFKTAEGIGLGASSFDVARVYGAYQADGMVDMQYKQRGLYFLVTKDHRIWSIIVRN